MLNSKLGLNNILDVTLRDGGYLNEWNFSHSQVLSLIKFLNGLGLQKIEIGFLRAPEDATSLVNGCPSAFLAEVKSLYPDMNFVGMLKPSQNNFEAALADKLPFLSLIRMPCTPELVETALSIAKVIRQKGLNIKISLNIICISSYSYNELSSLMEKVAPNEDIDILYFADSRGALRPHEIEPFIALAKTYWIGELGFHAHDTLGNAIENSDRAFACGCRWIDASLNGFGLAGGNTSLISYMASNSLVSPDHEVEQEARKFWLNHLPLEHPADQVRQLYGFLAERNIDPVWTDQLIKHYGDSMRDRVAPLPRAQYQKIETVLAEILNPTFRTSK